MRIRRKTPADKVAEIRSWLLGSGVQDNPEAIFLLVSEMRSVNSRLSYVIGALSIITVLFLAHIFAGMTGLN